MLLSGTTYTRRDIEARVGLLEQIGGVRRLRLTEGVEDGVEIVEVRTGAGLAYRLAPHRGLDIGLAEFAGTPFSWLSPNRIAHPAYFRHEGLEWLRTAAGGLLMSCGMRQVGAPSVDDGEALGIHGRLHHAPAHNVAAVGEWRGDEYEVRVSGTVAETRIFGENLLLHRAVWSRLGENRLCLRDRVENIGFEPSPLMMLYHFNFGFPLLTPEVELTFPPARVEPREAETPLAGHDRWEAPVAGYRERVYYHRDVRATRQSDGGRALAEAVLRQPRFPVAGAMRPVTVRLRWDIATLPNLVQWKNPGTTTHALGIEPTNCTVGGRAADRARGTLQHIAPGETVEFFLELVVEAEA